MKEGRVKFPCDDISLEGVLGLPEGDGLFPAVVVCHPHPLVVRGQGSGIREKNGCPPAPDN